MNPESWELFILNITYLIKTLNANLLNPILTERIWFFLNTTLFAIWVYFLYNFIYLKEQKHKVYFRVFILYIVCYSFIFIGFQQLRGMSEITIRTFISVNIVLLLMLLIVVWNNRYKINFVIPFLLFFFLQIAYSLTANYRLLRSDKRETIVSLKKFYKRNSLPFFSRILNEQNIPSYNIFTNQAHPFSMYYGYNTVRSLPGDSYIDRGRRIEAETHYKRQSESEIKMYIQKNKGAIILFSPDNNTLKKYLQYGKNIRQFESDYLIY
jgi:hypothetical protein